MVDLLLKWLLRAVLALRYSVTVRGLDEVAAKGTGGILFLPNHPAFIDPPIVLSQLFLPFRPRVLADETHVDRPVVRWVARRLGVVGMPDIRKSGPGAREQLEARVRECLENLKRGDSLLLYPSGHLYRTKLEDLRGNSAVESALQTAPDARVVLVRTRGLWGSSLGMAAGEYPDLRRLFLQRLRDLLANFVFFTPRRDVTIDLFEPDDLPRNGGRAALNEYIERYYNEDAPPATYVPYTIWEREGRHELPEPENAGASGAALGDVPESTRKIVFDYLREKTGVAELPEDRHLAKDLGMDSLARTELLLWLGKEFGAAQMDPDAIQTVGDVLLAARGQAVVRKAVQLKPVPAKWFAAADSRECEVPPGETIAQVFLTQARRHPRRVVVADQARGAMTYADLITAILVLKPVIEALPGDRIGILLPASCGAVVAYLATMFTGRTPVMVNWTTGARNIEHCLELTGVRKILTSKVLVERLAAQGTGLGDIRDRLVFLENVASEISKVAKLWAALRARLSWGELRRTSISPHAVILFTSGSEAVPKAVPLTHENILSNVRDMLTIARVRRDDSLVGFLPPFHSFGITVATVFPLISGVRAVYHPNPTEAWVIARLIEKYKPTVVLGTPTFLSSLLRASGGKQLDSLRLVIAGAEKCPERVFQAFAERCPSAKLLEGYGVTECSPLISANREADPHPGTIGYALPSMEYAIVDAETNEVIASRERREGEGSGIGDRGSGDERGAVLSAQRGQVSVNGAGGSSGEQSKIQNPKSKIESRPGLLLVRGPNVFPGYIGAAPSPFVELAGRQWYRTGDLISQDERGVLTFRGRLKRFVKLGGEMISLPAIEAALEASIGGGGGDSSKGPDASSDGPAFAIEATPGEDHPEVVLFTTRDMDRAEANRIVRESGLSPLYNISRVERIDAIPVLGTGKTDYRALKERLAKRESP